MSFVPVCDCHSPPTAPATPTIQALVNELTSVENWYLLGVNLGLQVHQLRAIERNYPHDNDRRKIETLDLWQRNAKSATWEAVPQALCLMQEHVVADAIRRKYCCSSTTGEYSSRKAGAHNKHNAIGLALIETLPLIMRQITGSYLPYCSLTAIKRILQAGPPREQRGDGEKLSSMRSVQKILTKELFIQALQLINGVLVSSTCLHHYMCPSVCLH